MSYRDFEKRGKRMVRLFIATSIISVVASLVIFGLLIWGAIEVIKHLAS